MNKKLKKAIKFMQNNTTLDTNLINMRCIADTKSNSIQIKGVIFKR